MTVTVQIQIDKPREIVWKAITDIENAENMISGISAIHVLHKPEHGLAGLKWEETRKMFGKSATETMWVTDAIENEYYDTRAESHGSVYLTRLSLRDRGSGTMLAMSFTGIPQTTGAKILSFLLAPLITKSIKKALLNDLRDIKTFTEK
ncbi:MAG: SRPBCC family protein [Gammaproteobacteria bacterium]|nr:SRPBCC family protein [Gammaproteobacteria bacterium]